MSLLEELLAPIEGDTSVGPELSDSNEFAAIETTFQHAFDPPLTPDGVEEETGGLFEEVVDLASEFLGRQSKDLRVAVRLAISLHRVEGFPGLATGLDLIKGLLKGHWEELHPGIPSRVPILSWMGSEDVSFAVLLTPLTELDQRHRHHEYREWVKKVGDGKSGEQEEASEGEGGFDFGSGFGQTSWEWYNTLVDALSRCESTLSELEVFGKERFEEAGEKPPRYSKLAEELKKVKAAGEDLLSRKPAPPKPKTEVPTSGEEMGAQGGTGSAEFSAASAPTVVVSAEPKTPDEAARVVAVAARVLRRERPGDPSGYLLTRGLRWGELRAGGEHIDPRVLEAPTTAQRTHLKSLFLDKKFEELLEAAEELMATTVGRGWLDLQRYAVLAADRLGQEYKQVGAAIRSATANLLRDVPALLDASLMDDSPTASRDTMSWLEADELFSTPDTEGGREKRSRAAEADRIIRDSGYDRAAALARSGDPEGAVEMLMERSEHERSERDRFVTKSEAAGIMVGHEMSAVARPILDELMALIDKHQLEDWEPTDVVSKPIGLLIRCLDPQSESSLKEQLHPRLAKLDPLLAMQVNRMRAGAGGGSGNSTAGSEQSSASEPNLQENSNGEGNG